MWLVPFTIRTKAASARTDAGPRGARGPGGARAHHRRARRHAARHDRLFPEEQTGAGEVTRADRLLDAGAGGVDEPDHGHPLRVGDLTGPVALDLSGAAHRT